MKMGCGQSEGVVHQILVLILVSPICSGIMTSSSSIRRQATVVGNSRPPRPLPAPGFPAEELLPPPALSASFPTLRPRRPSTPPRQNQQQQLPIRNTNTGFQQPPRDLIPPFRPSQSIPNSPPRRPQNNSPPPSPQQQLPLLPPIEIPPERPLTDNEILDTIVPKETSFIPTTGQGVPTPSVGIAFPGGAAPPSPQITLDQTNSLLGNSSSPPSAVRFPTELELESSTKASPPPRNCPSCECTNEVDYICASNGVLYLNSCSFDCATFCDSGIRKAPLEYCSSQNQKGK